MLDPLPPRTMLGNFEPLLRLATGGMATVYVARQVGAAGFERIVVIKRVHPHLLTNSAFYDMFREEARVSSLLHHPNAVPVTNVVEWEGELLLVMEYVESTSLSTLNKNVRHAGKRMPLPVIIRIIADTLHGLQAAHEALDMRGNRLDLVHRDVSPQNIVVGTDGVSRLIDFGIAKARHSLTDTREGSLKGKFGYMSPEQTKGLPLDGRADIFSAGVVLHETLTGKPLFHCANEFEAMRRINEDAVPNPSSILTDLPSILDPIVQKALQKDREKRFQTAADFLEALENAISAAPAKDVQAVLKTYCGERLARRRAALQAMLDGTLEPLRFTEADDRQTTPSHASQASQASRRDALTIRDGPETHSSVTNDTRATPAVTTKRKTVIVAGAIAAIVAVSIAIALAIGRPPTLMTSVASIGPASSHLSALWAPTASASAADSASAASDAGETPDAASSATRKPPPRVVVPPKPELHGNPYGDQ
ncbi:MAG: serine/threonine protein kinase [Deltaproteobacteria bacterium]|nr:serine/threonine protein kinase [Deltaproteobacteria bacterium]